MRQYISRAIVRCLFASSIFVLVFSACQPDLTPSPLPTITQAQRPTPAAPSATLAGNLPVSPEPLEADPGSTIEPTETPAEPQAPTGTPIAGFSEAIFEAPLIFDGYLGSPLILFHDFGGVIYLQDVTTGNTRSLDRELRIFVDDYPRFLGWKNEGCSFLLYKNFDIVEVDLRGNILGTVFSSADFHFSGEGTPGKFVDPSLSQEWVAFYIGQGELYQLEDRDEHHYDQEDLVVMSIDGKEGPYRVSKNGGAWRWAWSPDSSRIAYLDYDKEKNFQVFVSDRNGMNRQQLTDFPNNDQMLLEWTFQWSPDGQFILMVRIDDHDHLRDFYLMRLGESHPGWFAENVDLVWWGADGSVIIWKGSYISWVNPVTGEVVRVDEQAPEPTGFISLLGSETMIGCLWDCFGNKGFGIQVYDLEKKTLVPLYSARRVLHIQGWLPAPATFPGEEKCTYAER